jgi:hypothetical protein
VSGSSRQLRDGLTGRVSAVSSSLPSVLHGAPVRLDASEAGVAALALCGASLVLPEIPGYPGVTCPLRAATGVPCPLCGLTTSLRALLALDPAASLALSPLGAVVFCGGLAALGRWGRALTLPRASLAATLGLSWIVQLLRFPPL